MRDRRGQAITEFILALTFLGIPAVLGTGWLLNSEWDRLKCNYWVFEKTHQVLRGDEDQHPDKIGAEAIEISNEEDRVVGEASCGKAKERVEILRIEPRESEDEEETEEAHD